MFIHNCFLQQKNTGNKYPLIGKWTNKLCYTHTIEYYSAMKINKLKLHRTTCMDGPWKNILGRKKNPIKVDFKQ